MRGRFRVGCGLMIITVIYVFDRMKPNNEVCERMLNHFGMRICIGFNLVSTQGKRQINGLGKTSLDPCKNQTSYLQPNFSQILRFGQKSCPFHMNIM